MAAEIGSIVFDMDDTLYLEADYARSGIRAADGYARERWGVAGFLETAIALFEAGVRQELFNRTLERIGIRYNEETIADLVRYYRSHAPDIELLEDARWVLGNVGSGVRLGLISDGFAIAQRRKAEALGLDKLLHAIVLTDELGGERKHWKPSPLPYETVVRLLGVPHGQCLYVGDNPAKDFIAANRLGWTTVRVRRQDGIYAASEAESEGRAYYEIEDLRELADLNVCRHLFVTMGDEVRYG